MKVNAISDRAILRRPFAIDWFHWLRTGLPWLVFTGIIVLRAWISQTSGLMYDEPVTLYIARAVREGQLPFIDFYEHHSPLPWYLLAWLAPFSLWRWQRLLVALGGAFALLGLFRLVKRVWGWATGMFALLLGGVSPLWQHQGNMLIHDSFLVILLIVTFVLWWHALQKPRASAWLLVGFCAGLVVLCKQTGVISAFALGIGVLCFTRDGKAFAAYLGGGCLAILPLGILYAGHYEELYQGLLGWNMAANAYWMPNPKLKPFLNDIFWAHPLLWGIGAGIALPALRHLRHRFPTGDPRPLTAVAGLSVVTILGFNWFLSRQTFGQYYVQALPALILLASQGLSHLAGNVRATAGRVAIGAAILYLGILNPLMNSLTPWTPDLKDKLRIAQWLRQEVNDPQIWEPWVYYAYLAGKEFNFFYPFLSIHSMQNDPSLPFIDGEKLIPLERHLVENDVRWIVVHHPILPALQTRLERIFTGGPDDWQMVKSFQVPRYYSEAGAQSHLWTPWWKPEVFEETVAVWHRHPAPLKGGIVGDLSFSNPTGQPYLFLEVRHPGGSDLYRIDDASTTGKRYRLGWHQMGHSFFLSGNPSLIHSRTDTEPGGALIITLSLSYNPENHRADLYQVRVYKDSEGRFCEECLEMWQCLNWGDQNATCERAEIDQILNLTAIPYEALDVGNLNEPEPHP